MSEYVPAAIRRLVRERAQQTCEYCLIHETDAFLPHEPDHIIAVKYRGETNVSNLSESELLRFVENLLRDQKRNLKSSQALQIFKKSQLGRSVMRV